MGEGLSKVINNSFARFLVAGGIAALVNFGSRILLNVVFSYSVSIVVAYLLGMLVAFILCKVCVFDAGKSSRTGREALVFVAVNALAIVQTLVVSVGLNDYVLPGMGVELFRPEIAHAVGVVVPVFTSYLGHKYFSFGNTGRAHGN